MLKTVYMDLDFIARARETWRGRVVEFALSRRGQTVVVIALGVLSVAANFGLPGMSLDEVNHAAYAPGVLSAAAARAPHWRLHDNLLLNFLGIERFPILGGSTYNSTFDAYLGLPVFLVVGFSLAGLRIYHGIIGVVAVWAYSRIVRRVASPRASLLFIFAASLSVFVQIASRTRANYFLTGLALFGCGVLVILDQSGQLIAHRRTQLIAGGVLIGLAMATYFIAALSFVAPTAWILLHVARHSKRRAILFFASVSAGFSTFLYGLASALLQTPSLRWNFGLPSFAKNKVATFSTENLRRVLGLWKRSLVEYADPRDVVGQFRVPAGTFAVALGILLVLVLLFFLWETSRFPTSTEFVLLGWPVLSFAVCTFFLQGLKAHHFTIVVLPILALFAGGLTRSRQGGATMRAVGLTAMVAGTFVMFVAANVTLRETGGVGLYAREYSEIESNIRTTCPECFPVFVSWGMNLQFLFLTEGSTSFAWIPGRGSRLTEALDTHSSIVLVGSERAVKSAAEFLRGERRVGVVTLVEGPYTLARVSTHG